MRTLGRSALADLPDDVQRLVRDGVYSLFEVRHPNAKYVLITKGRAGSQVRYLLSPSGAPISSGAPSVDDLAIVDAVTFTAGETTVRINVG